MNGLDTLENQIHALGGNVLSRRENHRSVVGELQLSAGSTTSHRAFYKICKEPGGFESEVAALERAHEVVVEDEARSVVLRFTIPDQRAIVTEYIPDATSLFNHLWNHSSLLFWKWRSRRYWRKLGASLGTWLRAYHQAGAGPVEPMQPHVRRIVENTRSKIDELASHPNGNMSPDFVRKLDAYLSACERQSVDWSRQPTTWIHGDFDPVNVLLNRDNQIRIIDFTDSRRGFGWEDLLRQWHAAWAISESNRLRRRPLSDFNDGLLQGYGARESLFETEPVKLWRVWNAVTLLLSVVDLRRYLAWRQRLVVNQLQRVNRDWLNRRDAFADCSLLLPTQPRA